MKKSLFFLFILFLSFNSCKSYAASRIKEKNCDDYQLDLSKITLWSVSNEDQTPCGSFDSSSGILQIDYQYKAAQIWLGNYDASDYNYLCIEYEDTSLPFKLCASYAGGSGNSSSLCERYRYRQYLELNSDSKSSVKMVYLQTTREGSTSTRIKSIYFTQKKVLSPAVVDKVKGSFDNSQSALDFVKNMKAGWNLGNSFDANSFGWQENPCERGLESEIDWTGIYNTEEIIGLGKKYGYSTIRIPVTWYNHIIDDEYTIDPDWMARVKQIVDWAIADGYYVILNEHHSVRGDAETTYEDDGTYKTRAMNSPLQYGDGYIVRNNKKDIAESKAFLEAVWTQIAAAFNGSYDEHLIFETMNEPRNTSHSSHQWFPALKGNWDSGHAYDFSTCEECQADYKILNEYNQVCLDAIRASGGNNAKRFVMIPSLCTGVEPALHELFEMPEDSARDKLILTVHLYPFGTDEDTAYTEFTELVQSKCDVIKELVPAYVDKGIPVVIGETGIYRKSALAEQIKWIDYFGGLAHSYGMSIIYWDTGAEKENSMGQLNRQSLTANEPDFVNAFVKAFE